VLLDVASIQPDVILLLDTFFMIVVHAGNTVAAWRKANYQDLPEHEAFRNLLALPVSDAAAAMGVRCPTPRLVECDQGGSQARFLLAKLNPSATHNTAADGGDMGGGAGGGGAGGGGGYDMNGGGAGAGAEIIFTDDISMNVFMQHLAKLAVVS
jgi:protein transport protein SEC23